MNTFEEAQQRKALYHTVSTHTHHMRGQKVLPIDETNENLITWCCNHKIDAIGVGSPWEPVSRKKYAQY